MGVPSLFDICRRFMTANVDELADVGDIPYHMIRPALLRIKTPGQLRELEKLSPHIANDDAELWHAFIKRDIPNGDRKISQNTPTNPASWHKVYRKLMLEDKLQQADAEAQLKAALNKKAQEKEAKKTNILNNTFITDGQKRGPAWGSPRAAPSGARALINAKTNADKLTILKRQTAIRQAGRSQTQSIPTHALQQQRGTVMQAPKSMVNQYSRTSTAIQHPQLPRPAGAASRPAVFAAPRSSAQSVTDRAVNNALRQQQEREAKLRALTSGSRPAPAKLAAPKPASVKPMANSLASAALAPKTSRPGAAPQPVRKILEPSRRPGSFLSKPSATPPKSVSPQPLHPTAARDSPSPPPSVSYQSKTAVAAPAAPPRTSIYQTAAPQIRKRRAYDPFLPNKKRKA